MNQPFRVEPEVAAALRTVLSSGRPSRFRVLTVACPRDHVCGRVYRTTAGLVLLHETDGDKRPGRPRLAFGSELVDTPPVAGPRAEAVAYSLNLESDGSYPPVWPMQCRCSTVVQPRSWLLLEAIAAGKRRLVVGE